MPLRGKYRGGTRCLTLTVQMDLCNQWMGHEFEGASGPCRLSGNRVFPGEAIVENDQTSDVSDVRMKQDASSSIEYLDRNRGVSDLNLGGEVHSERRSSDGADVRPQLSHIRVQSDSLCTKDVEPLTRSGESTYIQYLEANSFVQLKEVRVDPRQCGSMGVFPTTTDGERACDDTKCANSTLVHSPYQLYRNLFLLACVVIYTVSVLVPSPHTPATFIRRQFRAVQDAFTASALYRRFAGNPTYPPIESVRPPYVDRQRNPLMLEQLKKQWAYHQNNFDGFRTRTFFAAVTRGFPSNGDEEPAELETNGGPASRAARNPDRVDYGDVMELSELLRQEGWVETPNNKTHSIELPPELGPILAIQQSRGRLRRLDNSIRPLAIRAIVDSSEDFIGIEEATAAASHIATYPSIHGTLTHGRKLLTAEIYSRAYGKLKDAVRDDELTKAVKVGGQYLYPWEMFSVDDREQLRITADQIKWLPKWIKHHRNAMRIDRRSLERELPVVPPSFNDKYGGPGSPIMGATPGVRYTWLGHATGVVNVDGLKVLLDPVLGNDIIKEYAAWVRRLIFILNSTFCGDLGERLRPPACRIADLPSDLHVVILSHNHPDHIMEGDVQKLCRTYKSRFREVIWYVPEGVAWFLINEGCSPQRVFEFTWGESRTLSCVRRKGRYTCVDGMWTDGPDTKIPNPQGLFVGGGAPSNEANNQVDHFVVTFTAGIHWSGRAPSKTDHNHTLWGGFAIRGPRHNFYYGGDTAYFRENFDEFKKIGRLLGPFHLAVLPIGAYEPNAELRFQHVNPYEAVAMFRDLRAEIAVGVHWGTFRLSAEDFFDPMAELECALLGVAVTECRFSKIALAIQMGDTSVPSLNSKTTQNSGRDTLSASIDDAEKASRRKGAQPVIRCDGNKNSSDCGNTGTSSSSPSRARLVRTQVAGEGNSENNHQNSNSHRHRILSYSHLAVLKKALKRAPTSKRTFDGLRQHKHRGAAAVARLWGDPFMHPSNSRRIQRAQKLYNLGFLSHDPHWMDTLLLEATRFQTIHVGHSIQVEAGDGAEYVQMSRSNALDHVEPNAPDEQYSFVPRYLTPTEVSDSVITAGDSWKRSSSVDQVGSINHLWYSTAESSRAFNTSEVKSGSRFNGVNEVDSTDFDVLE